MVLNNSFVELRFDLGTGVAILQSQRQIEMGQWHVLQAIRTEKRARLKVNDMAEVQGASPGERTKEH